MQTAIQKEKAVLLHQLHHNNKILVLPNIWDPLGALLLEQLGYPAVASASASISYSNGYPDGENIPFTEMLAVLKKIVSNVKIPVTADIENGYADDDIDLSENIRALLEIGIAGINFEDRRHSTGELISLEDQCERIAIIKETARAEGTDLFINARTDVYIKATHLDDDQKLTETIRRGRAYKEAGADCFYPIFIKEERAIETVVNEVGLPVNILLLPGIPDFDILKKSGVSRLSLGPAFLKTSLHAMKSVAEKLLQETGMNDIMNNPITSGYLQQLVTHTS